MDKKNQDLKYIGPDTAGMKNKMTKNEIKKRFDSAVAEIYKEKQPEWFPEVNYAFDLIKKILKPYLSDGCRVLDLGAGTGNLSQNILEVNDKIKITLVDFSENMLSKVQDVLKKYKNSYNTVTGDIFNIDFKKNEFNAVVSSFAIHHGRSENDYYKLYKNIYKWLKKPGIFICCDVIDGDTDSLSEINESGWVQYLLDRGFKDEDTAKILSNYHAEDSPLSVRKHMNLLIKAGFNYADVAWKKYNFGIYLGIKSLKN